MPSVDALDEGRLALVDTTVPPARSHDPMFLLFALGDPGAATMVRRRDDCGLETIATAPSGRPIAEVFMTRTAEDTGSLIVMIGRWAADGERDGLIAWEANTVLPEARRFDPVWSIELYSGHVFAEGARDRIVGPLQNRPGRGTGFWPLRVHQGGRDTYYVWSEGELFSRAGFVAEP